MKLTVNGIPVRVVDRIEVLLEIPPEGDTILNGVEVIVRGGPLRIERGSKSNAIIIDYTGCSPDADGASVRLVY